MGLLWEAFLFYINTNKKNVYYNSWMLLSILALDHSSGMYKRETVIALTLDGINILAVANERVNTLFKEAITIDENSVRQLKTLLEDIREME